MGDGGSGVGTCALSVELDRVVAEDGPWFHFVVVPADIVVNATVKVNATVTVAGAVQSGVEGEAGGDFVVELNVNSQSLERGVYHVEP